MDIIYLLLVEFRVEKYSDISLAVIKNYRREEKKKNAEESSYFPMGIIIYTTREE